MRNFPTELWRRFQDFKQAPAILTIDDGRAQELTFWTWTRGVQDLAMALLDKGFQPGTRLGLVASNSPRWWEVAIATWLVGGCLVPLVPGRDRRDTLRCLARTGCDWIAVDGATERDRLRGPGGSLPPHLNWLFFNGDAPGDTTHHVDELKTHGRSLVRRGHTKKLARCIYELDPDAPTLVFFEPHPDEDAQGAFFSGRKIHAQLEALAHQLDLGRATEADHAVVASDLSFGWFTSFQLTLASLYAGHAVAITPPEMALDEHYDHLQPTHLICAPELLEQLGTKWRARLDEAPDFLKRMADTDESNWLTALGGLGERAARRFLYDPIRRDFGGKLETLLLFGGRCPVGLHPILDGAGIALLGHFGVPEAGITHVEHPQARRPDSAGRPIEGYATKIDGARSGATGELLIRGDLLFDDYWTGEGPRHRDEQGWLHTHQNARLDSGFLFLES